MFGCLYCLHSCSKGPITCSGTLSYVFCAGHMVLKLNDVIYFVSKTLQVCNDFSVYLVSISFGV